MFPVKHGIVLRTTRKICALNEKQSVFVCAQVAKACFPALQDVPLEDIVKEIKTMPGHCKKETYNTPNQNGDYHGGVKKMFLCPKYTVSGQHVTSFFVSYGGSPDAALIFERESTKNMNIDQTPPHEDGEKSFIKLAHYVRGLQFEIPVTDNNT